MTTPERKAAELTNEALVYAFWTIAGLYAMEANQTLVYDPNDVRAELLKRLSAAREQDQESLEKRANECFAFIRHDASEAAAFSMLLQFGRDCAAPAPVEQPTTPQVEAEIKFIEEYAQQGAKGTNSIIISTGHFERLTQLARKHGVGAVEQPRPRCPQGCVDSSLKLVVGARTVICDKCKTKFALQVKHRPKGQGFDVYDFSSFTRFFPATPQAAPPQGYVANSGKLAGVNDRVNLRLAESPAAPAVDTPYLACSEFGEPCPWCAKGDKSFRLEGVAGRFHLKANVSPAAPETED